MLIPLLAVVLYAQRPAPPAPEQGVQVVVDSGRHEVSIVTGPYDLTPAPPGDMAEMHHEVQPVLRFRWPVDGWLRGSRLVITDAFGHPLDHRLVHHLNLINFSRRQLFYPLYERLLALGEETGSIDLPRTVGVPVRAGMPMGFVIMWDDRTGAPIRGVRARLILEWTPANQQPRPVDVLPVYLDVRDPVGRSAAFDLPAGRSTFHADYTLPTSGRIIAVGGHIHDYGTGITLDDITSGTPRNVVRLGTRLDPSGAIESVDRRYPGIAGAGIHLTAGHRYRITGSYDNPTGRTIPDGAMVHLIYLFTPDRTADWPSMASADSGLAADLAWLDRPPPADRMHDASGTGHAHPANGSH
ncbi:MAG TPA: hypothetical protein VLC11_04605 [Gemmatimonadales bacterium]|nr:hypothetical protein [Gemmatimonadales bacterium]